MLYRHRTSATGIALWFIVFASSLFLGCGPSGYVEPIGKFQSSSAVVIASTKLYVSELNKTERDNYIRQKLSAKEQIKLTELDEVQVFNQEGLKARLDALDQLARYGDLLAKLANSSAPERVRGEATDLGEAVAHLGMTVAGLKQTEDNAFKKATTEATSIIGEVLNFVVQQKIESALNAAITKGETPINNLIRVIRKDVDGAYERKRSSISGMRTAMIDSYEVERTKGASADPEKLRVLADRISQQEDRWEAFATANPGDGLDAMAKAHSALVAYAKSAHKVKDFASLAAAMDAFAARAVSIGKSVQALREI